MTKYPAITTLFEQKKAARRRLAKLSFEEKIEIVERLRKRREEIKKAVRVSTQANPGSRQNVQK